MLGVLFREPPFRPPVILSYEACKGETMTHTSDEPPRENDVRRVTREVSDRLGELGIWLSGDEQPEDLAQIQEAVERFELAVESRGGDLMVDEGPNGRTREPDDPHFALPRRRVDESVNRYLERLENARKEVLLHPPKS